MAPNVQGLGGDITEVKAIFDINQQLLNRLVLLLFLHCFQDSRKKKKRKTGQDGNSLETEKQLFEQLMAAAIVDPNEPLYCFCR